MCSRKGGDKRPSAKHRRTLRQRLLHIQSGRCYWCECALDGAEPGQLDRVWPGKFGGSYSLTNLVLACDACNKRRGFTEAKSLTKTEARRVLAPIITRLRRERRAFIAQKGVST